MPPTRFCLNIPISPCQWFQTYLMISTSDLGTQGYRIRVALEEESKGRGRTLKGCSFFLQTLKDSHEIQSS